MTDISVEEISPLVFHASRVPSKTDKRTPFQKRLSILLILLAVGFERLVFYSLSGNLILFLTSNHIRWTSLHSITASLIFFGTSYASALIFSWISDAKLGRAKTIFLGFGSYVLGYVFFPLFSRESVYKVLCGGLPTQIDESAPYFKEKCSVQITAVLVITAIGVGAIQANMAVFGAEQIRGQQAIARYFNKYYIAVNTGSFLAFAIIAYIQQNENYFLGYCISSGLLGITIILFLAGYKHYNHVKPHDSVITNFFPVFFNAFQSWRKYQPHTTRIFMRRRSSHKAMLTSDQYENMDGSPFIVNEQRIPFLDYAKVENNGRFQDRIVDDIKSLRRIIVMFLLLIPYWLIYLQSDTTFIIQGVHMRVPAFQSKTRHMPVLWLSLSDQIIVILTLFILNTCVYKYFYIKNRLVSIKIRFVIGMIAATISMCLTGITEIFRQKNCNNSFQQSIGNTIYNTSDMSVFYQLPQYISIGLSEVFASVTSLEFAYLTAPQSAQSLVMSLRFCSIGLSSFLGSGYINVYENFYGNFSVTNSECKDAEKPELFYIYFFVLAGIQFMFIFIFLGCDRKYHIIKASQHRFNTNLFVGSTSETSHA
ncbi:unnamed protein product [Adineta steineri]|uniref:Uncharacterized protein n=2 Tax=Adineta steineri TaxID=433720 RepID=A0A818LEE6_9BILA|nr:unnamed protein product [Adineta steineri]